MFYFNFDWNNFSTLSPSQFSFQIVPDTLCPFNSNGMNVAVGCSCNAGFSGDVVALAIAPFFNSTCQGILLLESIYAYILHLGLCDYGSFCFCFFLVLLCPVSSIFCYVGQFIFYFSSCHQYGPFLK